MEKLPGGPIDSVETGEPPELTQGLHVERQLEARFTRKMVCLFPRTVCTLPQNPHMMYILASETRIKGLVPLADLAMASFPSEGTDQPDPDNLPLLWSAFP